MGREDGGAYPISCDEAIGPGDAGGAGSFRRGGAHDVICDDSGV